jgi:hypothetical protein
MPNSYPQLLLAAIFGLWAISGDAYPAPEPPREGEEVLAFDPLALTELSVQASGLRLIAHRWGLDSPFYIAAFTHSGVSTCKGGDGLMQVLRSLHSLRVVRVLSEVETRKLQEASSRTIRLRLTAANDIDVGEWAFYIATFGERVVVQSEHMDYATEVQIGPEAIGIIRQGCRKLGNVTRHG